MARVTSIAGKLAGMQPEQGSPQPAQSQVSHVDSTKAIEVLTVAELAPKPTMFQGSNPGAAGISAMPAPIRMAATNPPNTFEGLKDRAKGCAPCFLEIPKSHPQYDKRLLILLDASGILTDGLLVLDLFKSDWDSPNRAPPKVLGIYSIIQSEALIVRHDQYRWGFIGSLPPTVGRMLTFDHVGPT